MKTCPLCGGNKVKVFTADDDICGDCNKWFPAVAEVEEIYCHACSLAGGAEIAVYHAGPACKTPAVSGSGVVLELTGVE